MKSKLIMIPLIVLAGCSQPKKQEDNAVKLITLDPGHFHAALVQKSMYRGVDSTVHVYAPKGADVELDRKSVV